MTTPSGEQITVELSEENQVDHGLEELRIVAGSVRTRKFRAVLNNNLHIDRTHVFPESPDDLLPPMIGPGLTMKRSDFDARS